MSDDVLKPPKWVTDEVDHVGDLALTLAARAASIEEDGDEWSWRDIADAALTASRSYSDEIEEGVTQEDRVRAWPHRPSCYKDNAKTKAYWMDGIYDSVAEIQAFRAHRVAALKVQTGEGHG